MQGIYIHIPFCKQACHYCDFHFSTSLKYKDPLLEALHTEIDLRTNYLPQKEIDSIYFGGGTPSLLTGIEIERILDKLHANFTISPKAEITLEANPDDITAEKVKLWKQTGVNRLSIGIQSFFEEDLLWMNRAHNSQQATTCIDIALQSGIENITADLIYGFPLLTTQKWESNITKLLSSNINHFSAYSLTVEPKTALDHQIKKGKTIAPIPEDAAQHFEFLMRIAADKGWTHYEISNYCKASNYAVHNTNYWRNLTYLGLGPSAHSYNGKSRQWNVANNANYIKGLQNNSPITEEESLAPIDTFNEYIMTGLRTMWGIDLEKVEQQWGDIFKTHIEKEASAFIEKDLLLANSTHLMLSNKGKLLADHIVAQLFWVE